MDKYRLCGKLDKWCLSLWGHVAGWIVFGKTDMKMTLNDVLIFAGTLKAEESVSFI